MSSSATGVGMPICFLWAILLILTQKSSQKFGDVLGIFYQFGLIFQPLYISLQGNLSHLYHSKFQQTMKTI